jgi:hypothetical protein
MLNYLGPFLSRKLFDKTIYTKLIAYLEEETDLSSLDAKDKNIVSQFMKTIKRAA